MITSFWMGSEMSIPSLNHICLGNRFVAIYSYLLFDVCIMKHYWCDFELFLKNIFFHKFWLFLAFLTSKSDIIKFWLKSYYLITKWLFCRTKFKFSTNFHNSFAKDFLSFFCLRVWFFARKLWDPRTSFSKLTTNFMRFK